MKAIYTIISAALIVSGCHQHDAHEGHDHDAHDAHDHDAHHHEEEGVEPSDHAWSEHDHDAEEPASPNEISFSEAKQALFNIQTQRVALAPFNSVISASGQVLPSTANEYTVVSPLSGRVLIGGNAMISGIQLAKGQEIMQVSSNGVGEDLAKKAATEYEAARSEYERDSVLLHDNLISRNHFEQSLLAYESAKLAYEDLQRRGLKNGGARVSSPASGYLKQMLVSQGTYVEVGQPLAIVSQSLKLVLRADVSLRYAQQLGTVQSANFRNCDGNILSTKDMGGRVLSIGKSVEDNFVPVFFEFQNNGSVIPGSMVDVFLQLKSSVECISLPVSALVESQGIYTVYVRLDEDCFEARDVRIGLSDGQNVQILSGLNPGDEVVTNGAMKIRLASVSAVPSGHNHAH